MRVKELLEEAALYEAVEIRGLIEQVSRAIPEVIRAYVLQRIKEWRFRIKYDYKKEHGVDPPEDLNVDEQIIDNLETLIPVGTASPVYGAMTKTSQALTKIVQNHVREKFGDPVIIDSGYRPVEVPVEKIVVSVWWHGKKDEHYGGVFRSRSYHVQGDETKLEIVVDQEFWQQWLIEAVYGEITGEGYAYDEFNENIVNTFAHEYAHLEQNLKGQQKYTYSLIPQKGHGRNSAWANPMGEDPTTAEKLAYYGRPAEIDAFATGAAATVVDRIVRRHRIYGGDQMSDEEWNQKIRYALEDGIHGLGDEYSRYISVINAQLQVYDPIFKAKFLNRVKQRFLSTYYRRLSSYLR